MLDRTLQILGIVSSLGVLAGVVLVLLQLRQSEEAIKDTRSNNLDAIVGSSLLGEDFLPTYHRVLTNATDLTQFEKARFGEFLSLSRNLDINNGYDYEYFLENPEEIVWHSCYNYKNAVGVAWLELAVAESKKRGYTSGLSGLVLEVIKRGDCDDTVTWNEHIKKQDD